MTGSLIVSGARTPIGKLCGAIEQLSAVELGGFAIEEALRRAQIEPADVDYVFMGQVLTAGLGQIPARQAAALGGIPMSVPATSVNKVCLSGLNSLLLADMLIASGRAEVVVAGGMESMSNAPHVLRGMRKGKKLGDAQLIDTMLHDGLYCTFDHCSMGLSTERYTAARGISRQLQDEFSYRSHELAARATKDGRMKHETFPVEIHFPNGHQIAITLDEGIRHDTSIEALSKLKPAFASDGTITAGNSSQISDGAAAVVMMSPSAAKKFGATPMAEFVGYGQVAGPDTSLLSQPANAIRAAVADAGLSLSDINLFEINEAFAAVAVASIDELGVNSDLVNVNGGAIALGHPIGMSGTRLALTLAYQLQLEEMNAGVAALCGGGGQGDALVLKRPG